MTETCCEATQNTIIGSRVQQFSGAEDKTWYGYEINNKDGSIYMITPIWTRNRIEYTEGKCQLCPWNKSILDVLITLEFKCVIVEATMSHLCLYCAKYKPIEDILGISSKVPINYAYAHLYGRP